MKSAASALIESESLAQNTDNVLFGIEGALGSLVAVIGYTSVATAVMVTGFLLKAVASAYQRGDSISQNLDNIALAALPAVATAMPVRA